MRCGGPVLICATLVLCPAAPLAQTPRNEQLVAARRGLLADAQAASTNGDHARALDFAQRAGSIEMTPSLRLFIANEHLSLGHVVEALGAADDCVREAGGAVSLNNREAILGECRQLVTELSTQVGRVVVRVPSSDFAHLSVTVGSTTLPPVFFGAPYVVAPGALHVSATADGWRPFTTEVHVAAGTTVNVEVRFADRVAAISTVHPARPASGGSVAPVAVLVSGGAVAVAGALLVVIAHTNVSALQSRCDLFASTYYCAPEDQNPFNTAVALNTGGIVVMAVGGAAAALGATWLIARRPGRDQRAAGRVSWTPALALDGRGMGGLVLRGEW
jgi:hypothetical protein